MTHGQKVPYDKNAQRIKISALHPNVSSLQQWKGKPSALDITSKRKIVKRVKAAKS